MNTPAAAIRVSVVVPTYNNALELGECLTALRAAADAEVELIVVDDASTDDVSSTAAYYGAHVLRLPWNSGPAAARNHGARHARGEILFFVDADVVVAGDSIARVRSLFERRPEVVAVFGSYDANPRACGFVSQYRNLLHHFVHQAGNSEASTFWAGCGAIRRSVFEQVRGFDAQRFTRPSIEDIELGYRLRRAHYGIFLDKSLQCTHLKRWTLRSTILTDVGRRAIPWSRLMLESGQEANDLNIQSGQRIWVALSALAGLLVAASPLRLELLVPALACVAATIIVNRSLYAFFWRVRGPFFAAACIPLHLLYFVCCGLSYAYVWAQSQLATFNADGGSQ